MASKLQTFLNKYGSKETSTSTPLKGKKVEVFSEKWNRDTANLQPPSDEAIEKGLFASFGLDKILDEPMQANPNVQGVKGTLGEVAKTGVNFATFPGRVAKDTLYDIPKEAYGLATEKGSTGLQKATDFTYEVGKNVGEIANVGVVKPLRKIGEFVLGGISSAIEKATGIKTPLDEGNRETFQKTVQGLAHPIKEEMASNVAKVINEFLVEHPDQTMLILDGINHTVERMKSGKTQSYFKEGGDSSNTVKMYDNMIKAGEMTPDQVYSNVATKTYQPQIAQQIVNNATQSLINAGKPQLAAQLESALNINNLTPTSFLSTAQQIVGASSGAFDIVAGISKPVMDATKFAAEKIGALDKIGGGITQNAAVSAVETAVRDTAKKYVTSSRKLDQMEGVNGTKPIETISSYGNKAIPELENGKINPTEAIDFLDEQIGTLSQIKNDVVFLNENTVSLPDFHKYTFDLIDAQKSWTPTKKAAIKAEAERIFEQFESSYGNKELSLSDIDLIKSEQTGQSKSYKNPNAKFDYDTHGILGKASRNLVELFTDQDPIVKDLNKLIQSHYDAIELYESMRGKAPHGGMLSKNLNRLGGEIVGSVAGATVGHPIIGAIAGRVGADMIMGVLNNQFISSPLKRMLIKNMEGVPSDVVAKALKYIDENSPDISELGDYTSLPVNQETNLPPNSTSNTAPNTTSMNDIGANPIIARQNSQVPQLPKAVIPKELEGIAKEARKYKSAEEFKNAYNEAYKKAEYVSPNNGGYFGSEGYKFGDANIYLGIESEINKMGGIEEFYKRAVPKGQGEILETTEYKMSHRPSKTGAIASDISKNGEVIPKDVYDHPEWYANMKEKTYQESFAVLKRIKGNPEAEITIYRSSPKKELNNGDWVTLSKTYADEEGLREGVKTYSYKVKAKDIQFAGDDINEFGYYPSK